MSDPENLSLFEPEPMSGEELQELGMSRVEAASDPRERDKLDEALLRLAKSGKIFTAEDVRTLAGAPTRPNLMGTRFHHARKLGLIETCGSEKSNRRLRRGGVVWRWRGTADLRSQVSKEEAELTRQRDKELQAMDKVLAAIEGLDKPALLRVFAFVVEKSGVGPVGAALAAEAEKAAKTSPVTLDTEAT